MCKDEIKLLEGIIFVPSNRYYNLKILGNTWIDSREFAEGGLL